MEAIQRWSLRDQNWNNKVSKLSTKLTIVAALTYSVNRGSHVNVDPWSGVVETEVRANEETGTRRLSVVATLNTICKKIRKEEKKEALQRTGSNKPSPRVSLLTSSKETFFGSVTSWDKHGFGDQWHFRLSFFAYRNRVFHVCNGAVEFWEVELRAVWNWELNCTDQTEGHNKYRSED